MERLSCSRSMTPKKLFDLSDNRLSLPSPSTRKGKDSKCIVKRNENKKLENMVDGNNVVEMEITTTTTTTTTKKIIKRIVASTPSKQNDSADLISPQKRTKTPKTPVVSMMTPPKRNLPALMNTPQRRPEILVATPRSRTPNNKIVYSKSYIQRALLLGNRDGAVDENELKADSRKIVLEDKMDRLSVVPRDIDSEQLEEIKQIAAQDKNIDILSQLREHSTQTLIIAHCTPKRK